MDSRIDHLPSPARPIVLDLSAEGGRAERWQHAGRDIAGGAGLWRLGLTLGWLDIKLRYRGSVLGPFWLTLSTGVMVGALGAVYGTLFHMDLHNYLPFLALSLVLWNAMNALVGDACTTFTQSDGTIRSVRMPYFVYSIRTVVRAGIALLHNLPVIVAVYWIENAWPGAIAAEALPGTLLWLIDAFAACLLLGTFCARFRDVPQIIASVMQIAFFVTPIVWRADQLGAKAHWLLFNPFYSLIEIVRAPMLGHGASSDVWAIAVCASLVLCGLAWSLFARVRGRIAFWI